MESVRPATPYAALYYRSLQRQLLKSKQVDRVPSKVIYLSSKSIFELKWWTSSSGFAANCSAPLREPGPTVEIWSDSNMRMGGARNSRGQYFQRSWDPSDLQGDPHINILELRAAKEALLALSIPGDRVRFHIDNRSACAYIRHQGGTKSTFLSQEAVDMWQQAISRNITILTPHWISSKENAEADFLSRNDLSQWEFYLKPEIFKLIQNVFKIQPTLDAFASRETAQLSRYMSWLPDKAAVAQDALLNEWDHITYLFPPVPLLFKVLGKVKEQGILAILICPRWPSALWWTMLEEMLLQPLLSLPHYREALQTLDGKPVKPYMEPLIAAHVSGNILGRV